MTPSQLLGFKYGNRVCPRNSWCTWTTVLLGCRSEMVLRISCFGSFKVWSTKMDCDLLPDCLFWRTYLKFITRISRSNEENRSLKANSRFTFQENCRLLCSLKYFFVIVHKINLVGNYKTDRMWCLLSGCWRELLKFTQSRCAELTEKVCEGYLRYCLVLLSSLQI
jgi:hypothetical protein